jgi:hypothetical protein
MQIDFLPKRRIDDARLFVQKHISHVAPHEKQPISNIEKAEALEALGILEFYEGHWSQSVHNLNDSLLNYSDVLSRRSVRRLAQMRLLVMKLSYNYKIGFWRF